MSNNKNTNNNKNNNHHTIDDVTTNTIIVTMMQKINHKNNKTIIRIHNDNYYIHHQTKNNNNMIINNNYHHSNNANNEDNHNNNNNNINSNSKCITIQRIEENSNPKKRRQQLKIYDNIYNFFLLLLLSPLCYCYIYSYRNIKMIIHCCIRRTSRRCCCQIIIFITFFIGICNIYDDTIIRIKLVNGISFSSSCISNNNIISKSKCTNNNYFCNKPKRINANSNCNNVINSIKKWRGGSSSMISNNIDNNNMIPKKGRNTKRFSLSNRFMFGKPTITITVRDPYNQNNNNQQQQQQQSSSSLLLLSSFDEYEMTQNNNNEYDNNNDDATYSNSQRKGVPSSSSIPFLDISSIHPTIQWNIFESKVLPLPNWFPSFKSLKGSIGYDQYHNNNNNNIRQLNTDKNKNIKQQFVMYLQTFKNQIQNLLLPSWYESTMQFALPGYEKYGHTLLIQPTYYTSKNNNNHNNNHINVLMQLSRGVSYIQTNLSNRHISSLKNKNNNNNIIIETIKGYLYYGNLPFVTLSSITIIPIINFISKEITCQFEMTTIGIKRGSNTRAVMNLEYNNPTLTIYYSPNEYNIISPTISLYTANIIYQWKVLLRNNHIMRHHMDDINNDNICGSFTMKVDPLSHIQCTWIDETKLDYGGHWITDITIPFTSSTSNTDVSKSLSTPNSLLGNASVRIRRKFQF